MKKSATKQQNATESQRTKKKNIIISELTVWVMSRAARHKQCPPMISNEKNEENFNSTTEKKKPHRNEIKWLGKEESYETEK